METIAVLPETDVAYQLLSAHIKDGKVYYCLMDYETKEKTFMCYEAASQKGSILATDYWRGFLAMKDDMLLYEGTGENGETTLALLDTTSGKTEQIPLPECVAHIWDADIDGDTIALYYYDQTEGDNAWNQTDNIAVFERGEEDILPIFSFPTSESGATWLAYHDDIEFFGDQVLWIYQQNSSGDILDHYHMTVYNHKTHNYVIKPASFGFTTDGEDLYWLRWDENINKADLYKTKQEIAS